MAKIYEYCKFDSSTVLGCTYYFSNKDLISPLVIVGFLGSFTTFSAFTKEVFLFSSSNGLFVAYFTALMITSICLLSTFIGYKIFA